MVFTCSCHNIDQKARAVLRNGGDPEYLTRRIIRGKESVGPALSIFSGTDNAGYARNLVDYLRSRGKYVVVLGYDDNRFVWRDAVSGSVTARLDAEAIVEAFCNR